MLTIQNLTTRGKVKYKRKRTCKTASRALHYLIKNKDEKFHCTPHKKVLELFVFIFKQSDCHDFKDKHWKCFVSSFERKVKFSSQLHSVTDLREKVLNFGLCTQHHIAYINNNNFKDISFFFFVKFNKSKTF